MHARRRGRRSSTRRGHDGLLTGYVMQLANRKATKMPLIEDVLWGSLDGRGREALVRRFLGQGGRRGRTDRRRARARVRRSGAVRRRRLSTVAGASCTCT